MTTAASSVPDNDALALVRRDLEAAFAVDPSIHERWFAVGDNVFRIRFLGTALAPEVAPAIEHLEVEPSESATLTINAWDTASTGAEISPLLESVVLLSGVGSLTPRREVRLLNDERVRMTVVPYDDVLSVYDTHEGVAYYWTHDPKDLPYWERGAPFRTMLNWWLSSHDVHCVHAGAVGTPEGAVMLTGRGGSGKSTSALACLGSQLQYMSDDYCAFSLSDRPEVFSLYNTGKLNDQPDLDRQPHFVDWVVNPHELGREKLLMFVHRHAPEHLLSRAPLRALIIPEVTGRDRPKLSRISGALGLRALAPTSLVQLPGSGATAMATMAALARAVPCYRMETGPDLPAIPKLIGALLDTLNGGRTPPGELEL